MHPVAFPKHIVQKFFQSISNKQDPDKIPEADGSFHDVLATVFGQSVSKKVVVNFSKAALNALLDLHDKNVEQFFSVTDDKNREHQFRFRIEGKQIELAELDSENLGYANTYVPTCPEEMTWVVKNNSFVPRYNVVHIAERDELYLALESASQDVVRTYATSQLNVSTLAHNVTLRSNCLNKILDKGLSNSVDPTTLDAVKYVLARADLSNGGKFAKRAIRYVVKNIVEISKERPKLIKNALSKQSNIEFLAKENPELIKLAVKHILSLDDKTSSEIGEALNSAARYVINTDQFWGEAETGPLIRATEAVFCDWSDSSKGVARLATQRVIDKQLKLTGLSPRAVERFIRQVLTDSTDTTSGRPIRKKEREILINTLRPILAEVSGIDLSGDHVNEEYLSVVTEIFKNNTSLTEIKFRVSQRNDEAVKQVAKLVRESKNVVRLDLCGCQITPLGAKTIAELLKETKLVHLDISSNDIGAEGVVHLIEGLRQNRTLTTFEFDNSNIGDEGVKLLMEALRGNQTLKSLSLEHNQITSVGMKSIAKFIEQNIGLTTLILNGNTTNVASSKLLVEALFQKNRRLTEFQFEWRVDEDIKGWDQILDLGRLSAIFSKLMKAKQEVFKEQEALLTSAAHTLSIAPAYQRAAVALNKSSAPSVTIDKPSGDPPLDATKLVTEYMFDLAFDIKPLVDAFPFNDAPKKDAEKQ